MNHRSLGVYDNPQSILWMFVPAKRIIGQFMLWKICKIVTIFQNDSLVYSSMRRLESLVVNTMRVWAPWLWLQWGLGSLDVFVTAIYFVIQLWSTSPCLPHQGISGALWWWIHIRRARHNFCLLLKSPLSVDPFNNGTMLIFHFKMLIHGRMLTFLFKHGST